MLPSNIKIAKYNSCNKADCLNLFRSNQHRYFDASEYFQFERFLDGLVNGNDYYIASLNSKVVGAGGYSEVKGKIWLDWGMVDYGFHGQGVGSLLLDYRIKRIVRDHGPENIYLCTSQYAVGFYEKHGFSVLSVVKDGYGSGLDKLTLRYIKA